MLFHLFIAVSILGVVGLLFAAGFLIWIGSEQIEIQRERAEEAGLPQPRETLRESSRPLQGGPIQPEPDHNGSIKGSEQVGISTGRNLTSSLPDADE